MTEPIEVFLGFDPGGEGNFGWSICQDDAGRFEQLASGTGNYAGEVLGQVLAALPENAGVLAAGIDAPLFWNRRGEIHRTVDEIIRAAGARRPRSINELVGAVVAQGPLLAALLRQHFVNFQITEAFPGALRDLLQARSADNSLPPELERYAADLRRSPKDNENHEWDALAAAYAAWRMYQRDPEWSDLLPREPDPVLPLGTPVSYWMPIP